MSDVYDYPAWKPPIPLPLTDLPEHPCPYLPDRQARFRGFACRRMAPGDYEKFMDAGFRRSGTVFYQPICRGCRKCLPLRVPTDRFHPGKSQRRCARRNQDLTVQIDAPVPSNEKYRLYVRYLRDWHHSTQNTSWDDFLALQYESPVNTIEMTYRDPAGRLLAVGHCDLGPRILSSVYFYFDPKDAHRGLGVFGALEEIQLARRQSIPWYYLGYWVEGCRSMQYKADYRPCQVLHPDGVWRPVPDKIPAKADQPPPIRL